MVQRRSHISLPAQIEQNLRQLPYPRQRKRPENVDGRSQNRWEPGFRELAEFWSPIAGEARSRFIQLAEQGGELCFHYFSQGCKCHSFQPKPRCTPRESLRKEASAALHMV